MVCFHVVSFQSLGELHGNFLPHKLGLVIPDYESEKPKPRAGSPLNKKKGDEEEAEQTIEPRVKVLRIMKGVRVADFQAFEIVARRLQKALRTWDT